MKDARAIFAFLLAAHGRGERAALVTVTGIEGSSSRGLGTHMAVSEAGSAAGSLSGGCVEAAVVAEAQRILAAGRAEQVRFGAGSRYIDIRLPCGGGLDLLFAPLTDMTAIEEADRLLAERRPALLHIDTSGTALAREAGPLDGTGWRDDTFLARHDPDLRLLIIGHGAEPRALARQAGAFGALVKVLTPDAELAAELDRAGIPAHRLLTPGPSPHLRADPATAVVMLFHDHDWEPRLLAQALATDAFFVGAMGSRRTHAQRVEALRRLGEPQARLDALVGPIGLIPAVRDPDTLALSTLAQIVSHQNSRAAPSSLNIVHCSVEPPARHFAPAAAL